MTDPFSLKPFTFPKNFLFGSATAGHQIEGNNVNASNYAYELECHEKDPSYALSGLACNSYEMFEADNQILATLGHKMYRMSIEWSRIQPSENEFSQKEVDHYIQVFESLKKKGIKICLSLTHGTVPIWFWKKESFYKMENLPFFEKYIAYTVPKIDAYVDYYLVLNEPNGGTDPKYFDFKFNAVRYHARAYHIIKQYSNKPVSTALMMVQQFGKRQNDKFDLAIQNYYDVLQNEFFLHAIRTGELVLPHRNAIYDKEIKNSCDFWSINTYRRRILDTRVENFSSARYRHEVIPVLKETDFKEGVFHADALIHNLTRLIDKPVLVSENGIACDNDDFRIVYIAEYLSALHQAMEMGVDVIGYLYWSLLDNYEWSTYVPRFGLVDVDRENGFKRTIKKSGYFYRDIIQNNGFNQEILRKHLHEIPRSQYAEATVEAANAPKKDINAGAYTGGVE